MNKVTNDYISTRRAADTILRCAPRLDNGQQYMDSMGELIGDINDALEARDTKTYHDARRLLCAMADQARRKADSVA